MADEEAISAMSAQFASLSARISSLEQQLQDKSNDQSQIGDAVRELQANVGFDRYESLGNKHRIDELYRRIKKTVTDSARSDTPGGVFRVNLTKSSGSDGSASAAPTYKYDVTNLNGVAIASDIAPEWRRDKGRFVDATKGLAYRNAAGVVKLAVAFEEERVGGCA